MDPVQRYLSDSARELLNSSGYDKEEHYAFCCSIAMSVLRHGGTEDDFESVLEGSDLASSYKYGDRKWRYDIQAAWSWAEQEFDPQATAEDRETVRDELRLLRDRLVESSLKRNILPTLDALITEGINRGAWSMNISVRDLGQVLGVAPRTVSRHLAAAEEADVLHRMKQGEGLADLIALNLRWTDQEEKGINATHKVNGGSSYMWHNSVFSRHGLGPTAGRVYGALATMTEPASAAEVARAAGVDPATARKHLPRLVEHGLAVEIIRGRRKVYEAVDDPDFDVAALLAGVEQSQDDYQTRVEVERELYAKLQQQRATQRETPNTSAPAKEPPTVTLDTYQPEATGFTGGRLPGPWDEFMGNRPQRTVRQDPFADASEDATADNDPDPA